MGVSKAAGDVLSLVRHGKEADTLERALAAYESERLPVQFECPNRHALDKNRGAV